MRPLHRSKRLLLCVGAAIAAFPCAFAQRGNLSPDAISVAEQYLLSAANQERAAHGLAPLHRDPLLALAAEQHARTMAAHREISHQFAGEPELRNRGANAGVGFSVISENVGQASSVVDIHEMWMHSEHHRTNLLDPSVDSAGISVIARNGELYAVEDFAKTVRPMSLVEQEFSLSSLIARPGGITLADSQDSILAARQTCNMSTGYAGSRRPSFVMRFTSDSITQLPDQLKSRLTSGRYREAAVGACASARQSPFTSYSFAVLLFP